MFTIDKISYDNKAEFYEKLNIQMEKIMGKELNWLGGIANAASLLYLAMEDIDWVGFYLYKDKRLVLGPFQGKPAHPEIDLEKGLCGMAAKSGEVKIAENEQKLSENIPYGIVPQSEIAVPIKKENRLMGVLDIYSPVRRRFDDEDIKGLKGFVGVLNNSLAWPKDSMDISQYQHKAMRTKRNNLSTEGQILNACLGLAGEVGECVDHIKKGIFHGHKLDKDYIKKELGDIAWYIALMSDALDLDMGDIYKDNIAKLEKRYPEGFNMNRSINRDEK